MTPDAAAWHRAHPMPKHPTTTERLAWHVEHQRACACRPIPARLLVTIRTSHDPTAGIRERHRHAHAAH